MVRHDLLHKFPKYFGKIKSTVNLNSGLLGGSFGVGNAVVTPTVSPIGFSGNIPEFILFPEPLTVAQYGLFENNQISFWGSF